MSDKIQEIADGLEKSWREFQKANDEKLTKLAKGESVDEINAKLEKIEKDLDVFSKARDEFDLGQKGVEELKERIDILEAGQKKPGKTAADHVKDQHKELFLRWMRSGGQDDDAMRQAKELVRKGALSPQYAKDVTIGTTTEGGFALPEEIAREIEILERRMSPVRDTVKVRQVGTNDYKELVTIGGTTSGWVGETGTRSATATSAFRERAPTMGELYAYPQSSEWALDDLFFNVEAWIAEEVAQEFAVQEGQAVIDGNGTSRPTGILNTAPVATADGASPLRSAEAIEYVDSPNSPSALDADTFITMVYTANTIYRANAVWAMNSATTGAARRLKDSQNQYLWAPGLEAGQPDRFLGYPVRTWEQLPDVAVGNFPILFGDFNRAYLLVDRVGLRITRDNVTNIGFVKFYVRRREGGIILNNDAIKAMRT